VQVAVKPSNFSFLLALFVVGVRVRDRELTCIFEVFFLAGNCIIWGAAGHWNLEGFEYRNQEDGVLLQVNVPRLCSRGLHF
jgi:hypothetical protein